MKNTTPHGNMRLYTNMIGRSQHRASRLIRGRSRHISVLSCPVSGNLPHLFDMTWSSIWPYTGVGGREETNAVTLKETNSNEESPAGRSRPIYGCTGEGNRDLLLLLAISHGLVAMATAMAMKHCMRLPCFVINLTTNQHRYAVCDPLTPSPIVARGA